MSQRVVTDFVNSNVPDAYPNVTVSSKPVGLGQSGILVILGEADGGNSYQNVALSGNSFTPDQFAKVQQQYISGQIVDAFQALTAPSGDSDITGTANLIYIVKTNQGGQASALVDTDYGTLKDKNWGVPGNNYKYQITSLAAEQAPVVQGGVIPAFGAPLNGQTFTIRLNGGAATVITLSATPTDHDTVAHLVIELNGLLPAGIVAAPSDALPTTAIKLTVAVDAVAYRKGWGKSFELFDSTPGDLAALGLVAAQTNSAQEPEVEIAINNASTGLSETLDAVPDIALNIGYQGTTASLTITSAGVLTTTVVGGSGANLTIAMSQYKTVADLASFIASQTGYTASAASSAQQLPPSALDTVTAIGIASSAPAKTPGRVKDASYSWKTVVGTSKALNFSPTATAGLPNTMATAAFLSGGTRGATSANDIVNAVNQMGGVNANIIIPLISQDATADITAGQTDSASTYTIAATNAAVKSHCIAFSTPKLKRNRIAILSFNGTYTQGKAVAQGLANYRCSLTIQSCVQDNSKGVITTFQPWYGAVIAAGMQAGGFYKSITNKLANIISFVDPSGYDSGSPGDVEDALSAGLLVLTTNNAGDSWVSDQTTYGFDTNFVYNSIQAVYASDLIALDLASSFKAAFVGKSLADVSAATALAYLSQKMDGYKRIKLIASSDDAPLGFKNAKVSILAPEMDVSVEIKLATAIYFIPISINISQVQQAA